MIPDLKKRKKKELKSTRKDKYLGKFKSNIYFSTFIIYMYWQFLKYQKSLTMDGGFYNMEIKYKTVS